MYQTIPMYRHVTMGHNDKLICIAHQVQAHRESAGTVSLNDGRFRDPIAEAEELAFGKACARFGFGLHLYHEDETP
ncbi:hypothetical protein BHE74_00017544 [Ensete ventricosum]|nr:hypothetical protein BHE74_00017544 [Ensete ventricosum]